MILVLTGTHHQPFDRLVRAAATLVSGDEEVVVQRGASRLDVPGARVQDWWPHDALEALADQARIVVAHAGPGSLFLAWDRGRIPVVWPRRAALGEHVDDHQVAFAATLGGRARVVHDVDALHAALKSGPDVLEALATSDPERGAAFCRGFEALADAIVARGERRRGGRGTFPSVPSRSRSPKP